MLYSTMANVGIRNSWSLPEFKNLKGKMKVTPTLTNSETGEHFKTCAFVDGTKVTLVGFGSGLSDIFDQKKSEFELAEEIAAQKDSLQVVELESGKYKLCKKGESSWADVNI